MVDLLRFVLDLAVDQAARDRFRAGPEAVLGADVDDCDGLTGEDVEAVAEAVRRRVERRIAERLEVPGPVRPVDGERPYDAAVRLLVGLCDALDGPAVAPVALPRRERRPDPAVPRQPAGGGGEPVPTEPPGERWLHPVITDGE